jgi:alpha/beta superfamily hydrolase
LENRGREKSDKLVQRVKQKLNDDNKQHGEEKTTNGSKHYFHHVIECEDFNGKIKKQVENHHHGSIG